MTNQELEQVLEEIRDQNGGTLTPEAVWKAAREPDHPLHTEFTWDVEKAAENWWTEQARRIIRRVQIVETVSSVEVRAPKYVRDPRLPPGEQGYAPTVTIRTDEDAAKKVLFDELDRVDSALKRARAVASVLGLGEELEALTVRIGVFRQTAEAATEEEAAAS